MFLCFLPLLVQLTSAIDHIPTPRPISPCPDNSWLPHTSGSSCLKPFSTPKVSWSDARSECRKLGADLVQIRDAETNKQVRSLLANGHRYWTGASDSDEDGTFEYLNGRSLSPSYQPWAIGEPNNKGGSERCVEIIGKGRGSWNDKRCSKKRAFVCEVSTRPIRTTPRAFTTTPRVRLTTARIRHTTPRAPITTPEVEYTTPRHPVTTATNLFASHNQTNPAVVLTTDFELDDLPLHFDDPYGQWRRTVTSSQSGSHALYRTFTPSSSPHPDKLITPPLDLSEPGCMTFYFKVQGGGNYVQVYLNDRIIFQGMTFEEDSYIWSHAAISLHNPGSALSRISVWVGSERYTGSALLDNFVYREGLCHPL